jgi:thiamine transporter ThiT
MKKSSVRNLAYSGLFLALCLLLPFLTGQIPQFGNMLLPMHLPVLLCGFICGWPYGLAVGFISPLLRSMLFGMPPMFPTAVAMAFELAVYGLLSGLFYKIFPKKNVFIYVSLLLAMVGGRLIWGAVAYLLFGIAGTALTWQMFLSGAILVAWPGILIQIVLIPVIVMAINRTKRLDRAQGMAA